MSIYPANTHTHTHTLLTVEAPVESIEGRLQRPAGFSDQSLGLSSAQTSQVLLHGAGTTSWTLRTHPQMFTWQDGKDTKTKLIKLIVVVFLTNLHILVIAYASSFTCTCTTKSTPGLNNMINSNC